MKCNQATPQKINKTNNNLSTFDNMFLISLKYDWSHKNWSDSRMGKALSLHLANLSCIPSTTYVPLSTARNEV